jgi:type I restriction enzyme S subunit
MKPAQLLAHFDRISEAPDAVPRLRQFILELAFLARFSGEGQRAITLGQCHKGEAWRTKALGEIATEITPGFACAKSHQMENGFVHLRTHNVSANGRLNSDLLIRVDPRRIDASKAGLRKNDILFNNTNSQELVGKTCLVDDDYQYAFSNHLTRIRVRQDIDPSYLVKYFTLLLWRGDFARLCNRWIGQAGINTASLRKVEMPIPPLDEQRRIVAQVDELMALCDRLEAAQAERESRRDRLVAASLHRLNEPADPPDFREHAQFHLRHLPRLATRPEHIQQLRQTILNLAMRGKLMPQDLSDEPASAMLSRKAELPDGHERRRKILKKSPVDALRELFHAIPPSWQYADVQTLYDLNAIIDYADGNHGSLYPRGNEFGDTGVTFVTAKDLVNGRVVWRKCAKLAEARAKQLVKGWARGGDVLLTHNATVGRVAQVEPEVDPFLLGTSVTFYRLNPKILNARFFYCLLKSSLWQGQLEAIMAQTTRNQVSIQKQAFFRVVVPPLAEQHRIVTKVDDLMEMCDRLEAQLATAQSESRRLLEAVLHEALAPPA